MCSTLTFGDAPHPRLVFDAMLDWGAQGALSLRRLRELAVGPGQRSSTSVQQHDSRGLRDRIRAAQGSTTDHVKIKVSGTACTGWLARLGPDSDWIRRWWSLDMQSLKPSKEGTEAEPGAGPATAPTMAEYEDEQQRETLSEFQLADVCAAFQPDTPEMRANNTFLVALPSATYEYRAASEKEVR